MIIIIVCGYISGFLFKEQIPSESWFTLYVVVVLFCFCDLTSFMNPDSVCLVFLILFVWFGCRMDDAEACFILSNRFEVDRFAAVCWPSVKFSHLFCLFLFYPLLYVCKIGRSNFRQFLYRFYSFSLLISHLKAQFRMKLFMKETLSCCEWCWGR